MRIVKKFLNKDGTNIKLVATILNFNTLYQGIVSMTSEHGSVVSYTGVKMDKTVAFNEAINQLNVITRENNLREITSAA